MALDSLVESLTTHRLKPIWQHGYVGPFAGIYAVVLLAWKILEMDEYYELGLIALVVVGLFQVRENRKISRQTSLMCVPLQACINQ